MLKIGIIGESPGNGHPYSWSAIINGRYNPDIMEQSGYPVISQYLNANRDSLGIESARVTHVWAPDKARAEKIAAAAYIPNVVENPRELIGSVDAVILARDDPESHQELSRPFIEAGIPIFIDKPLTIDPAELDYYRRQHLSGRLIMSCSSMRYARENQPYKDSFRDAPLAVAVGKKDWIKYGVHMLEGLLALLGDPTVTSVKNVGRENMEVVYIELENATVATVHLFQDITPTFQISLFARDSWRLIEYKDWYAMFRANLAAFIVSVQQGRTRLEFERTENVILTLIAGLKSRQNGGREICPAHLRK